MPSSYQLCHRSYLRYANCYTKTLHGNGKMNNRMHLTSLKNCSLLPIFSFISIPILLACDASNYEIEAVLAHRMPDESERPMASRSLTQPERNYSQLEKEGLSCIFGVNKFHSYLFGHLFDLITNHKPLLTLLNEHKPTSPQASATVHRWSLLLFAYEYVMKFRCTSEHSNADTLSRVPLREIPAHTETPAELFLLMEHLADSPVTAKQIQTWSI